MGNIRTIDGNSKGLYKDSNRINSDVVILSLVLAMITKFLTGILYAGFLGAGIFQEFADFVSLSSGNTTGLPRPVVIGLIFLILYLTLVGGTMILSFLMNQFERDLIFKKGAVSAGIVVAVGAILMFGMAALFQWIYQMDAPSIKAATKTGPETYVFIIDNSLSMQGNDPAKQAVDAVYDVMQNAASGSQFMVYKFDNAGETRVIRNMGPYQDSSEKDSVRNALDQYGGTALKDALVTVLSDYQRGNWSTSGPVGVILLTDGDASDIPDFGKIRGLMNDYVREGIPISTVGLGKFDKSLLSQIANATNGKFVSVSNAAELSGGFASVKVTGTDTGITDDLLHMRFRSGKGLLYGSLRVVFLTILGVFLALMVLEAYGLRHTFGFSFFVVSIPKALIGALLLELKTGLITLIIYWILISLTIVKMRVRDNEIRMGTRIRPR